MCAARRQPPAFLATALHLRSRLPIADLSSRLSVTASKIRNSVGVGYLWGRVCCGEERATSSANLIYIARHGEIYIYIRTSLTYVRSDILQIID